jgi:hypothetical protein
VKAVGAKGVPWTLTVVAGSDLRSGVDSIPISVVSWTSSPNPPYRDGVLSAATPRVLASGLTHVLNTFTMSFSMANSWVYNAGNYGATITFTLAAP